jgi:hypothetical protein
VRTNLGHKLPVSCEEISVLGRQSRGRTPPGRSSPMSISRRSRGGAQKRSGNLSSGTLERCPERNMPMTALVLLMALSTSVAFALGFVLGWIYQIRGDELERRDGFPLPPTARIPQP